MRRPLAGLVAGLVAATLLLGACGVDAEAEADPAADRARAEAAILTLEELPAGFVEGEPDESSDDDAGAEACLEESGQDVTGDEVDESRTAQVTREFDADQGTNVEAEISVFENDDVPSALIEVLGDDAALQCLVDTIEQEGLGEGVSIAGVAVGEAPPVPELGDQRGAASLEIGIEASGQRFDFVSHLYAVRVDRAVATLTVTQLAGQELAQEDVDAALDAMVTRLAADD